jgi:hypothetical protein
MQQNALIALRNLFGQDPKDWPGPSKDTVNRVNKWLEENHRKRISDETLTRAIGSSTADTRR